MVSHDQKVQSWVKNLRLDFKQKAIKFMVTKFVILLNFKITLKALKKKLENLLKNFYFEKILKLKNF